MAQLDPMKWQENYEQALASLDADQRAVHDAVLYGDPGVFRISAGAGSGKTKTTVVTIATAINKLGIGIGEIAALTFTRQGAAEMRERLSVLVPPAIQEAVLTARGGSIATFDSWISTRIFRNAKLRTAFRDGHQHSGRKGEFYAIDWWMRRIADVCPTYEKPNPSKPSWFVPNGIPGLPNFTGLDYFERRASGKDELSDDEYKQVKNIGAIWTRVRAEGLRFDRGDTFRAAVKLAEDFAEATGTPRNLVIWAIQKFEEARTTLGLWDTLDVMDTYMRHAEDSRRLVFVDESQDNNRILTRCAIDTARRAQKLGRSVGRAALVGDSAQSIFYFRGASPEVFQDLERTEGAKALYLPRNYRSAYQIVQMGNLISEGAQWGMGVPAQATRALPGDIERIHDDESLGVLKAAAEDIQRHLQLGVSPGQFAIIAPTNALVDAAQVQLDLLGIPSVRLGTMKGVWDVAETTATLTWVGIGVGAPLRSADVVKTMSHPKLPYIGAAILTAAERETDVIDWALRGGAGTSGQRGTLRRWADLCLALREAFTTLGWEALIAAVATVVGDDEAGTISWSSSKAVLDQLETQGTPSEGPLSPELIWPALIDRVRSLRPEKIDREVGSAPVEDKDNAVPGPAQAALTAALVLGSYDKLMQHAIVCRKTPTVEEDMPFDVAADPVAARAWVETAEQLRKHRVSVCTVWVSKGLEWHTVFGVCPKLMFDGTRNTFPAQAEERYRLLYVMGTRAAERLVFCTYTMRGVVGPPAHITTRVLPYVADQQRLQSVVEALEGTQWRISGVVRGIQNASWAAGHPVEAGLVVSVTPQERGTVDDFDDIPVYVTPHTVALRLGDATYPVYTVSSPLAAGWASACALQLTQNLGEVIPAEHKAAQLVARARESIVAWRKAHGVPGEVLLDGPSQTSNGWDTAPVHVPVKQRYLAWLLREGLTEAYRGLRDITDSTFDETLISLGLDVNDLCGKLPPTPPPPVPGRVSVGHATQPTDLMDTGSWLTLSNPHVEAQRDRQHFLPYPQNAVDSGAATQLGVFLGVEGGQHTILYTTLIPSKMPDGLHVERLPVREGAIVVALTTRRVGDLVDIQGTASIVGPMGALATLVSWRLPPGLTPELRHRVRREVVAHLLSSMTSQPAPLGSWQRILYEAGVGLFLSEGSGFSDPTGDAQLFHPQARGRVTLPLLLPKTARVA